MKKFHHVRGGSTRFIPEEQFKPRPRIIKSRTTREFAGERIGFLTKETYEALYKIVKEHGEVLKFNRTTTPEEKRIMDEAKRNFYFKHHYYRQDLIKPFKPVKYPFLYFDDKALEKEKLEPWFNSQWYSDVQFQLKEYKYLENMKKDDLLVPSYWDKREFKINILRIIQLWKVDHEFGERMEAICKGEIEEFNDWWWFPKWLEYRKKRMVDGIMSDFEDSLRMDTQVIFEFEQFTYHDFLRIFLLRDLGLLDWDPLIMETRPVTNRREFANYYKINYDHYRWTIRLDGEDETDRFLPHLEARRWDSPYYRKLKKLKEQGIEEEPKKEIRQKSEEPIEEDEDFIDFENDELDDLEQAIQVGHERDLARERMEKIMRGEITFNKMSNKKGKVYYVEKVNGETVVHKPKDTSKKSEKEWLPSYINEKGQLINPNLPQWWFMSKRDRLLKLAEDNKKVVEDWENSKQDYEIIAADLEGNWNVVVSSVKEYNPALHELLWYIMEDWGDPQYRDAMTFWQFLCRTNYSDWDSGHEEDIEDIKEYNPDDWTTFNPEQLAERRKFLISERMRRDQIKSVILAKEAQEYRLRKNPEIVMQLAYNRAREESLKRIKVQSYYEKHGFIWDGEKTVEADSGKTIDQSRIDLASHFNKGGWVFSTDIVREYMLQSGLWRKQRIDTSIAIDHKATREELEKECFRGNYVNPKGYSEYSLLGKGRENMVRARAAVRYIYNGGWRNLNDKYGMKNLEVIWYWPTLDRILKEEAKEKIVHDQIVEETRQMVKENYPGLWKAIQKEAKKQKKKKKPAKKVLSPHDKFKSLGEEIEFYNAAITKAAWHNREKTRRAYDKAVEAGIIDKIDFEESEEK